MPQQRFVWLNVICSIIQIVGLGFIVGAGKITPPSILYFSIIGIGGIAAITKVFTVKSNSIPITLITWVAGLAGVSFVVLSILGLKKILF